MIPDWAVFTDGSLLDRLLSQRGLGMTLWIGLAFLTLSLLILMHTRWGQAKPMSKCVALSVFAHILFIGYAYGTRLIFDHPLMPEEQFIQLAVFVPGDEADVESEPIEQPTWQESFDATTLEPDAATAQRQSAEVELPDHEQVAEAPEIEFQPDRASVPVSQPERELEEPPFASSSAPGEAAPSEVAIEAPAADRQDTPQSPLPTGEPLKRLEMSSDQQDLVVPDSAPPPDLLQDASQLQRLSDVTIDPEHADALPDVSDHTDRADNRDPTAEEAVADSMPGGISNAMPDRAISDGFPGDLAKALAALPLVRRLGDSRPLPELYRLRSLPGRLPFVVQLGGSRRTEAAVEAALAWLASAQHSDGRWDASQFGSGREQQVRGHNRMQAGVDSDTGITGLALLALLGAGHTHFEGTYRKNAQHGLEYLLRSQKEDGNLAGQARLYARMYCHGIAALAVSEAYAMTGDHRMRPYVERAMQFTVSAQHPTTGGWRYQPADRGDTSQLGWQLLALKSAELAGIEVPDGTRAGMRRFLSSVSSGSHGGLASYRPDEAPSRPMTAEALTCRLFLERPAEATAREAVTYIIKEPPQDGQANLYYWYYGTLALFQLQGEDWQSWNTTLQEQLLRRQRTDGTLAGSWDADTVWGGYGGRVYSTALAALCLEVYYRYLPLLGGNEHADPTSERTTNRARSR